MRRALCVVALLVVATVVVDGKSPVVLQVRGGATAARAFGASSTVPKTAFPYSSTSSSSSSSGSSSGGGVSYERRTLTDFATRDSRMGFMRKVYTIFAAQMACTIGITSLIMGNEALQYALFTNLAPFMAVVYVASLGVITALVATDLRHRPPFNFLLLGLHTVLQSFVVGIFSSAVGPRLVCLGTVHTLATFLAITVYSFQPNPRYDLTPLGNLLLTAVTSLSVGSLLAHFFNMPLMDNLVSGAMAVVFATYLAYDTQKIVGGKHHKHAYGQNEYILAALNLYQDLIGLFMKIVKLLSKMEKSGSRRRRSD